jgi:peroxiredoxin
LADYQAHLDDFEKAGAGLLALSVDPVEKAQGTVEELHLTFPVAYGLEVPRDAEKIGAFWEERRKIFHATNFILDGSGAVLHASYATGPVGRIAAADALRSIQNVQADKKGISPH